jgi:hypothetical protein
LAFVADQVHPERADLHHDQADRGDRGEDRLLCVNAVSEGLVDESPRRMRGAANPVIHSIQ